MDKETLTLIVLFLILPTGLGFWPLATVAVMRFLLRQEPLSSPKGYKSDILFIIVGHIWPIALAVLMMG